MAEWTTHDVSQVNDAHAMATTMMQCDMRGAVEEGRAVATPFLSQGSVAMNTVVESPNGGRRGCRKWSSDG